jgi:hypothetical protein
MATFAIRPADQGALPRGPPALSILSIQRATTASSAKNQAAAALTTTTPMRRSSWR